MSGSNELGITYYPSCVVNMLIRFDENFSKDAALLPQAQTSGVNQPAGVFKMSTGVPLFDSQAGVPGSPVIGRIPRTASIELPGLRKPGKFTLVFDYRDLPIDPRLVRAVGIEIYLDTITANNFAQGVTATNGAERLSQITKAQRISAVQQSPKNLVLKGIVDSWHVEHSSSGSYATLEGRDIVGLFLNTPLTTKMVSDLELNHPIDAVIRQLVGMVGTWNKDLDVRAADASAWPNNEVPYLAKLDETAPASLIPPLKKGQTKRDPFLPRSRRSAATNKPRRSTGADPDKLNMWDLITRYCLLVGAVPYYTVSPRANEIETQRQGYKVTLMIVPQWGLYDYLGEGRAPTPFDPARPDVGRIRQLYFGRNIESLSLERKFQGITARAVEVVSYNPSSDLRGQQRMLSATSKLRPTYAERAGVMPPLAQNAEAAARSSVGPSGLTSKDEVLRIKVNGVITQDQLQQLADGLYEEIMRGELGGSVKTKSLASFGGNNADPDLLHIRPRDAITLATDIRPLSAIAPNPHTLIDEVRGSVEQVYKEVFERTGDRNLARAVAFSSKNVVAELQNTFRVNAVRYDWDISSGIAVGIDFHNYVMARDAILPTSVARPTQANAGRNTGVAGRRGARSSGTYADYDEGGE